MTFSQNVEVLGRNFQKKKMWAADHLLIFIFFLICFIKLLIFLLF